MENKICREMLEKLRFHVLWLSRVYDMYGFTLNELFFFAGDTDTNAAIAGALNGAHYGLKALESDPQTRENIELILKCTPDGHSAEFPTDTPRDPSVHASQLPLLVESYIGRFLCRDDVLPPSKRF